MQQLQQLQQIQDLQEDLAGTITGLVVLAFVAIIWLIALSATLASPGEFQVIKTLQQRADATEKSLERFLELQELRHAAAQEREGQLTRRIWVLEEQFSVPAEGDDRPAAPASADLGERTILEIRDARRQAEEFKKHVGNLTPEEERIWTRDLERRVRMIEQKFEIELAELTEAM